MEGTCFGKFAYVIIIILILWENIWNMLCDAFLREIFLGLFRLKMSWKLYANTRNIFYCYLKYVSLWTTILQNQTLYIFYHMQIFTYWLINLCTLSSHYLEFLLPLKSFSEVVKCIDYTNTQWKLWLSRISYFSELDITRVDIPCISYDVQPCMLASIYRCDCWMCSYTL